MAYISSSESSVAPFACSIELLQPQPLSTENKADYPTIETPDRSSVTNSTIQKSSPVLSSKTSIASNQISADLSHEHDMASSQKSSPEDPIEEPAESAIVNPRKSTREPKPTQKAKQLKGGKPAGALVISGKTREDEKLFPKVESGPLAHPGSSTLIAEEGQAPATRKRKLVETDTTETAIGRPRKKRAKDAVMQQEPMQATDLVPKTKKVGRKRKVLVDGDEQKPSRSLVRDDVSTNKSGLDSTNTASIPAKTTVTERRVSRSTTSQSTPRIKLRFNGQARAASLPVSEPLTATAVDSKATLTHDGGQALLKLKVPADRLVKIGPRYANIEKEAEIPPLINGPHSQPPQEQAAVMDPLTEASNNNAIRRHIVNVPCGLSCLDESDTIFMYAVLAQEVNRLTNAHLRKTISTWCKCRLRRTSSNYDADDPGNPRATNQGSGADKTTTKHTQSKRAKPSWTRWPPEISK